MRRRVLHHEQLMALATWMLVWHGVGRFSEGYVEFSSMDSRNG